MKIYGTMTRYEGEFRTTEPGKVGMYICGPTVHSLIHIGNTRPMVFFDTTRRYLECKGYGVNFVSNFTDVDDKTIRTANKEDVDASVIPERYIVERKKDIVGMNVRLASYNPRATEEIPGMTEMIQKLIGGGRTYVAADGTVYYRVENLPDYDKLSHRNVEENQAGLRTLKVCGEEAKEDPNDFVLWKPKKEGKPYWESSWCGGRSGQHIECSVMSKKYFGETIGIHGGGEDLVFPYHENKIAQSEAVSNKKFVCYWMHNASLNIDNVKMSKSLGNFKTAWQISEGCDPQVLRSFILLAHCRNPLNFSREMMDGAKVSPGRIPTATEHLRDCLAVARAEVLTDTEEGELAAFDTLREKFEVVIGDDFSTVDAISVTFEMVKRTNITVTEENSKTYITRVEELLDRLLDMLGLLPERKEGNLDTHVEALIAERQTVRKERSFVRAGGIRSELTGTGILLEDAKEGVKRKEA